MHNTTRVILKKLAAKANQADGLLPTYEAPISFSRFREYHDSSTSDLANINEDLEKISRLGWLTVIYDKASFSSVRVIKRLKVRDTGKLLQLLEIHSLSAQTLKAVEELAFGLSGLVLPKEFGDICNTAEEKWCNGKLYFNCSADNVSSLITGFTVVSWILAREGEQQIDYRTLSTQLLNESKELECNISLIEKLLGVVAPYDAPREKSGDLLAFYSVSRFTPSIRIKGAVEITTPKGSFDTQYAWPFIEVPPDGINLISVLKNKTSYVMFIENKTSFERYCREIDDRGLIIFTNGFPSRAWQKIIKQLSCLLPEYIPFYHWGDIDPGGYRIFQFMAKLCSRDVWPHKMTDFSFYKGEGRCIIVSELVKALSYFEHGGSLLIRTKLVSYESNEMSWIEQETQTPSPPRIQNNDSPNNFKF